MRWRIKYFIQTSKINLFCFYHLPCQALFYLPLNSFGNSWWKWKIISAFLSFPGIVFVQSFFMKNTWYVNWGADPEMINNSFKWSVLKTFYHKIVFLNICNYFLNLPSLVGLAFLIQSVRCRTKSKKKSPSGTEITLSAILTKRLNPSADLRFKRWAMFWQKSFALVEESTSNAYNTSFQK